MQDNGEVQLQSEEAGAGRLWSILEIAEETEAKGTARYRGGIADWSHCPRDQSALRHCYKHIQDKIWWLRSADHGIERLLGARLVKRTRSPRTDQPEARCDWSVVEHSNQSNEGDTKERNRNSGGHHLADWYEPRPWKEEAHRGGQAEGQGEEESHEAAGQLAHPRARTEKERAGDGGEVVNDGKAIQTLERERPTNWRQNRWNNKLIGTAIWYNKKDDQTRPAGRRATKRLQDCSARLSQELLGRNKRATAEVGWRSSEDQEETNIEESQNNCTAIKHESGGTDGWEGEERKEAAWRRERAAQVTTRPRSKDKCDEPPHQ